MSLREPSPILLPGATLGVFGSGQLGRMFAMAGKQLGYRVHVFSPEADSPAGQVADREFVGDFTDLEAVDTFAQSVDVITLEFENVPTAAVLMAAKRVPVRPGAHVLEITQDRIREKSFLRDRGIPVTPFRAINNRADLDQAEQAWSGPAVLKTATLGYDGKGQVVVREAGDLAAAWERLAPASLILEDWVDFQCELSVVAARTPAGQALAFPPTRNLHHQQILDISVSPTGLPESVIEQATQLTLDIMRELDAIGVLCVEYFLSQDGRLLVNEIAPRPHNSGHLTLDAHATSQFEQQVRAICGLELGSTRQLRPAAMANLLGDCWSRGEPDWKAGFGHPNIRWHLSGKQSARKGRKMGHLTVLADDPESAMDQVVEARNGIQI